MVFDKAVNSLLIVLIVIIAILGIIGFNDRVNRFVLEETIFDLEQLNAIRGESSLQTEIALYDSALERRDPGICRQVMDDTVRDSCLKDLSKETENLALCGEIVKDSKRDSCILNQIDQVVDCDTITNTYLRNSCVSIKALEDQ